MSLTRFMAKSGKRALPFFKILKKGRRFSWTKECEVAFQKFKETLSAPLTLTNSDLRETLYLYLAIAEEAISATLVKDTIRFRNQYTSYVECFRMPSYNTQR